MQHRQSDTLSTSRRQPISGDFKDYLALPLSRVNKSPGLTPVSSISKKVPTDVTTSGETPQTGQNSLNSKQVVPYQPSYYSQANPYFYGQSQRAYGSPREYYMPQNVHPGAYMYMYTPYPYYYDPEAYMQQTQGCMSAYCCYRAPEYVSYMHPHGYEGSPSSHYYPHAMPKRQMPERPAVKNCSQKENSDDDRYDNVRIKLNNIKNDQKEEF